jgi:predicted DCC family thiol-disulfide oxidoreductase YuxK
MNQKHDAIEPAAGNPPVMACEAPLTIYFDGSCPLCSAEIGHYAGQRGAERLCFVDASDPKVAMGNDLSRDTAMRRFHVRSADGRLLSGARALVAIWETLPAWRPLARLARLPGVMILLEGAYRLFLPLRPFLSRIAARLGSRPRRDEAGATANSGR